MRGAPLAAALLTLGLVGYWAVLAMWAPGVMLSGMGEHDGLLCRGSVTAGPENAGQTEFEASECGLSLTPLFAIALALIGAVALLALVAALRPARRVAIVAAGLAIVAFVLVGIEAWLGRGSDSGTLSPLRTQTHLAALGVAATVLLRA